MKLSYPVIRERLFGLDVGEAEIFPLENLHRVREVTRKGVCLKRKEQPEGVYKTCCFEGNVFVLRVK